MDDAVQEVVLAVSLARFLMAHDRPSRLEAGLGQHDALAGLEPGEDLAAFGQRPAELHGMAAGCPVLDDVDLVELADPAARPGAARRAPPLHPSGMKIRPNMPL